MSGSSDGESAISQGPDDDQNGSGSVGDDAETLAGVDAVVADGAQVEEAKGATAPKG